MADSLPKQLARARHRAAQNREKIVELQAKKNGLDLEIAALEKMYVEDSAFCEDCESRILHKKQLGMKQALRSRDGLSEFRPTRFRQVLDKICSKNGLGLPAWIATIKTDEIVGTKTPELLDKYFLSDEWIGGLVPIEKRAELRMAAVSLMSMAKQHRGKVVADASDKSEIKVDITDPVPGWSRDVAFDLERQFRAASGITAELAIQVSHRAMSVSTLWCLTQERGDWLDDSALQLMSRVRPIEGGRDAEDEKAAIKILEFIGNAKVRSATESDNVRRIKEAVTIFATPGAMSQGVRSGLRDEERDFCAAWFGDNRDFAAVLGHKVGSVTAFASVVRNPADFRTRYFGAAPKSDPKGARIWARGGHNVDFKREKSRELIEEARHALVDTTLHSPLVSLPQNRDRFLGLGPWEANEVIHRETVDVSAFVTKPFLAEAREAAEVEIMQGTNPLAMTAGLVTWASADGKSRQAPLFVAAIEFDESTSAVRRLSPFVFNRSLLRRMETDYPSVEKGADIFDALGVIGFQSPLEPVFAKVAETIATRTSGANPILKIEDCCLIGVFDSSRAVLERRLDLKVFPHLVGNPVVSLLAEGSKEQLVYGEYDPEGARSPSDEIQGLAVKAVLGGSNFVLEGPPGTGKTNTIVAMLEALSKAGKRVLVSAAMPGAIEVIGRRIDRAFTYSICSTKAGQIDVGVDSVRSSILDVNVNIVIGTPMALARALTPDVKYDVLIVDEASQLRLSHALSLVGHVKQIVIAGDSRQLQPPVDKNAKTTETSLLTRARQAGFPFVMLETHYRSLHPSLIAWSNLFSYDSRLKPKRAPWQRGAAGFDVVYIDNGRRVDKGTAQVNVEEAERIASEVVRWARDGRRSVGVAALTQAQRDLIRETVDRQMTEAGISYLGRQTEERALEEAQGSARKPGFFSTKEPFFIRTAGAVQGEERDVMLISLGVGPDAEGKINQTTGALGRADSVALTNVMLSRARMRTAVFSSIMPWQINMSAMTPGMFLVASILRMGTVVATSEMLNETIHPNFLSDEWSVDKFMIGKEEVHAIRTPKIPDRYAMALLYRDNPNATPAHIELVNAGWHVRVTQSRYALDENEIFRRLISSEIERLLQS